MALYHLALRLGKHFMTVTPDEARRMEEDLRATPRALQAVLDAAEAVEGVAVKYSKVRDMFFIGRNVNYPIALEGALKMKEISYIHAEGYAAGELKHGPLALLGPETPVVAIVPKDLTYEKMLSNIGEVVARGSPVIAVGTEGDREIHKFVDDVLTIPPMPSSLGILPTTVVVQLLAYYAARERGCNIDKPRHLAKSVTVE
jgi:glucosamine--fructose-6-phosphate aminotransferase (isomerizing)